MLAASVHPVCYNGNINTVEDYVRLREHFPEEKYPMLQAVMLGRGLIGDPGMLTPGGTTAERLEGFLGELLEEYTAAFGGSRNAMFRLKENWRYLFCLFQPDAKLQKALRKTTDVREYKALTGQILHNLPMREQMEADW